MSKVDLELSGFMALKLLHSVILRCRDVINTIHAVQVNDGNKLEESPLCSQSPFG